MVAELRPGEGDSQDVVDTKLLLFQALYNPNPPHPLKQGNSSLSLKSSVLSGGRRATRGLQ